MRSIWSLVLLGSLITYHCLTTVSGEEAQKAVDASQPTFDQCKPFVDAALKTSSPSEGEDGESNEDGGGTEEETSAEDQNKPPDSGEGDDGASTEEDSAPPEEDSQEQNTAEDESGEDVATAIEEESAEISSENTAENNEGDASSETNEEKDSQGDEANSEEKGDGESEEAAATEEDKATEEEATESNESAEADAPAADTEETTEDLTEGDSGENKEDGESGEAAAASNEDTNEETAGDSVEEDGGEKTSAEETGEEASAEDSKEEDQKTEEDDKSTGGDTQEDSGEEEQQSESDGTVSGDVANEADQSDSGESQEATKEDQDSAENAGSTETEAAAVSDEEKEPSTGEEGESNETQEEKATESTEEEDSSEAASVEEEEEEADPYEPRSREHITQILGLDDSEQTKTAFNLLDKVTQQTLKELKATYANSIQPLEQLYKYRDLSNRHFGDPEIFSKPLIVFMGPWSGGKSTIINWLLGIQHEEYALRTGADPSPALFNILMGTDGEPEKLDGTQLAATWSFSGLQKFGQSFLDRLSGQKIPNRLLEKVNIIEIPGILEVRKSVDKTFPFNDACQWFIDRADTLFLIYDPAKLDIGPETEAILDQLKGRESQVRIVLNKADTVKPDELLRVQAMLVWNISPLMSSAEPPVLYAASLWDRPLQKESPKSLLVAHENHFLKDIRDGIEKRVETRIAAARRFAVRIRNHAKMIDCYLNTYNNHRSFFSDRKKISTDIIDHPQNYHIYEGLSTLTNISRYDLPDPESYQQFFLINPLWEFPTLSSTCTFWASLNGCPLQNLDRSIAYVLPEILAKFKRQRQAIVKSSAIKN